MSRRWLPAIAPRNATLPTLATFFRATISSMILSPSNASSP